MDRRKSVINFIIYVIIGGLAAVIDYGIFFVLEYTASSTLSPEISSLIGQSVGFLVAFFLNTFYNFKKTDKLFKRFLSYLGVTIVGMIISTLMINAFKDRMDLMLLKFICLVGVSLIQFALNKLITYKRI